MDRQSDWRCPQCFILFRGRYAVHSLLKHTKRFHAELVQRVIEAEQPMDVDPKEEKEAGVGLTKGKEDKESGGPSSNVHCEGREKPPNCIASLGFQSYLLCFLWEMENTEQFDPWHGFIGDEVDPIVLSGRYDITLPAIDARVGPAKMSDNFPTVNFTSILPAIDDGRVQGDPGAAAAPDLQDNDELRPSDVANNSGGNVSVFHYDFNSSTRLGNARAST